MRVISDERILADLREQLEYRREQTNDFRAVEKNLDFASSEIDKLHSLTNKLRATVEHQRQRGAEQQEEIRDLRCSKHIAETDLKKLQEMNKNQVDYIKDLEARLAELKRVGKIAQQLQTIGEDYGS